MRKNTADKTLERNYQSKWKFLINEYELTKKQKHPIFRFVNDFYKAHNISRQVFNKYYNRYLLNYSELDLVPRKRGPKWKSRRVDINIEKLVLAERNKGLNKYEICAILRPILKEKTPSTSCVYNIFKRSGVNILKKKMKEEKVRIIKEKAGELGHIDCHHLGKDLSTNDDSKRYYLVCVIDAATRIAWAEVVEDIKSLTVMFAALKCMNLLKQEYDIQFEEILSDNGSEFSSRSGDKNKHPFERMLLELGVKHRYIRPYRPQINGKVERFWRTLNEDLIEFTNFDSINHFKDELQQYLLYYNTLRPHQGINGLTPKKFRENLSSN